MVVKNIPGKAAFGEKLAISRTRGTSRPELKITLTIFYTQASLKWEAFNFPRLKIIEPNK